MKVGISSQRKITLTKAVKLTALAGLPFPTPPPSLTTFLQTHRTNLLSWWHHCQYRKVCVHPINDLMTSLLSKIKK